MKNSPSRIRNAECGLRNEIMKFKAVSPVAPFPRQWPPQFKIIRAFIFETPYVVTYGRGRWAYFTACGELF